jgi:hypothetical protein
MATPTSPTPPPRPDAARIADWHAWCLRDPRRLRLAFHAEIEGWYWLYWLPTRRLRGPWRAEAPLLRAHKEHLDAWLRGESPGVDPS